MARLFVAIDLPPPLREVLAALPLNLEGARRTPAHQLHLTLRFIGDATEAQRAALMEALEKIEAPPLRLSLTGVSAFGQPPRVLWVGVAPEAPLAALAREIESAVCALGFPRADHPFAAHVTVARMRGASPHEVRRFLAAHQKLSSAPAEVEEVLLYSSVLSPGGAVHRVEARYPLRGSQSDT